MTGNWTTNPTISHGDVVVWFELIRPERAKQLLSTYHVDYRKFRPSHAETLAQDMISGDWNFDGATVRIDSDGNLFDGQHRLNAVILSEEPQWFLFVAGIDPKAYDTTDTGLARTYGDTLRRRGYSNVQLRTALIKMIYRWENGNSLDDTNKLTPPQLDKIGEKYEDSITRAVSMAMSTKRGVEMPATMLAFSWWILTRIDTEKAYNFLIQVTEGEMIRSGMPAYTLRKRLDMDKETGHTRNEFAHLIFQAWNAFVEGREITRLVLPKGWVSREKIEVPRNGAS